MSPKQTARDEIMLTREELAKLFGVTPATIDNWARAGMPRVKNKSYPLFACFRWWNENINAVNETSDIQNVKLDYWRAKAAIEQLREKQMRGSLIPAGEVQSEFTRRVSIFRSGHLLMLDRLPPRLVGRDINEIREILQEEFESVMASYAQALSFVTDSGEIEEDGDADSDS